MERSGRVQIYVSDIRVQTIRYMFLYFLVYISYEKDLRRLLRV